MQTMAIPSFLLPESVQRADGESPAVELGSAQGKLIVLTLGITRIIEQESLDVSIWASSDGQSWMDKPLAAFPQKFYCGTYTILVDLTDHPEVTHLKATWKMGRWGRGTPNPMFGFYLFAKPAKGEIARMVGV